MGLLADMRARHSCIWRATLNNVRPICFSISQKAICCVVTVSVVRLSAVLSKSRSAWQIHRFVSTLGVVLMFPSVISSEAPGRLSAWQHHYSSHKSTARSHAQRDTERESETAGEWNQRVGEQQLGMKMEYDDNLQRVSRLWNVMGMHNGLAHNNKPNTSLICSFISFLRLLALEVARCTRKRCQTARIPTHPDKW